MENVELWMGVHVVSTLHDRKLWYSKTLWWKTALIKGHLHPSSKTPFFETFSFLFPDKWTPDQTTPSSKTIWSWKRSSIVLSMYMWRGTLVHSRLSSFSHCGLILGVKSGIGVCVCYRYFKKENNASGEWDLFVVSSPRFQHHTRDVVLGYFTPRFFSLV